MAAAYGLRIGLGVTTGNPGIVGSGVATTTHAGGVPTKGKRNKASPQSSPQCHHGTYFTMSGPAKKHTVLVSQARQKWPGDASQPVIVQLGNLPASVTEEELAEILAPWGPTAGSFADEPSPESGSKTFRAQMEYQAAMDAISQLDQSMISGQRVVVVGEGLPPAVEEAAPEGDPDVLLEGE